MKTEEQYLELADEAADKMKPFSAVVYAFLGLISVFRDIRNTLYEIRNHLDTPDYGYTYIPPTYPSTFEPIITEFDITAEEDNLAIPFCAYCSQSLATDGMCLNSMCPSKQSGIGSTGGQVV